MGYRAQQARAGKQGVVWDADLNRLGQADRGWCDIQARAGRRGGWCGIQSVGQTGGGWGCRAQQARAGRQAGVCVGDTELNRLGQADRGWCDIQARAGRRGGWCGIQSVGQTGGGWGCSQY